MAADIDICNMALRHLGSSTEIQDLTAERSDEARACRRFFTQLRDQVLEDFAWPFATRFASPTLVETLPNNEWAFSYRLPAGCLTPRRILSGTRNDSATSRIPFRIASDDEGQLIYTDMEDAVLEYTAAVTDASTFSAAFANALALMLAAAIGPTIAGGDQFRLADRALRLYEGAIMRAQANAANAEIPDLPPEADMISARA